MTSSQEGTTVIRRGLAAWELSVVIAVLAGALAYVSASQPSLFFDDDGHACMGDGAEACTERPFIVAWIALWAIAGLILSPIALVYGRNRSRNFAAWSRFALSALPSVTWAVLLGGLLSDPPDVGDESRAWVIAFVSVPLGLWLIGGTLSALWIARGRPVGPAWFTTAIVASGYTVVAAGITLLALKINGRL